MARIIHDTAEKKKFETGDDHGILFVMGDSSSDDMIPDKPDSTGLPTGVSVDDITKSLYRAGVSWEGLTAVTVSPSGADETELWADNIKYASFRAAEKFGATIESYTYPEEFEECDGAAIIAGVRIGQQKRKKFGFFFRSIVGDGNNPEAGYKYHFIYNSTASPSEKSYATVNDSPDAITFSHEISADTVSFVKAAYKDFKPVCELTIDTTTLTSTQKTNLDYLLDIVYGRDATTGASPVTEIMPQLLSPDDILTIMNAGPQG